MLSRNIPIHEPTSVSFMDQYNSRAAEAPLGELDPLDAINVNYESKAVTKKLRFESNIASLKLKRRTKFKAVPKRVLSQLTSVNASQERHQTDSSFASKTPYQRQERQTLVFDDENRNSVSLEQSQP